MTDPINLSVINNLTTLLSENENYIQLTDISAEVLPKLKIGDTVMLEIMSNTEGVLRAALQTGKETLNIKISNSTLKNIASGQSVTIPVRIGTNGRLFPVRENQVSTVETAAPNIASNKVLAQVELSPLKPEVVIEKIIRQSMISNKNGAVEAGVNTEQEVSVVLEEGQNARTKSEPIETTSNESKPVQANKEIRVSADIDLKIKSEHKIALKMLQPVIKVEQMFPEVPPTVSEIPPKIYKQVLQIIRPLEVSLVDIGTKSVDMSPALQNLQEVLVKIAVSPQNFINLKPELIQAVKNLNGTEISGEVSAKLNGMTIIKTPIGETFFSSPINIPVDEPVLLNIGLPKENIQPEINFLDDIIKILVPIKRKAISPEIILRAPQLKGLAEINAVRPDILSPIIEKLPFQGNNIVENIYRFYQGAVNKDITQWLGKQVISSVSADTVENQIVIKELNGILSNAVKETLGWRMVEMPLFDGLQFSTLKVAVKKDAPKEKQGTSKKMSGTRFIIETDFSKLGGFQFDGFSNIERRNLDLIVRTTDSLSDDFCANVINLFKKSLYSLDYNGTIKINRRQAFVNLQETGRINKGIYV